MTRTVRHAAWRPRAATALAIGAITLAIVGWNARVAHAAKAPQSFALNYCWGTGWPSFNVCPAATLSLYANHTAVAVDQASSATNTGTWSTGRRSTITFTFPGAVYSGSLVSPACYQGTMTSPNVFGGGTWAGCFVH